MSTKERLDVLLVNRGLFESREKAKTAIMAGQIFMGTVCVDKAGTKVPIDADLSVKGNTLPYVSRGGLKLEKALQLYPIDLTDAVMIDIGASTGGFTDCALQNGAAKVFAIDVAITNWLGHCAKISASSTWKSRIYEPLRRNNWVNWLISFPLMWRLFHWIKYFL